MFSSNPMEMPLLLFGDHDSDIAAGLRSRNFLRSPRAVAGSAENEAFSAGGLLSETANSAGQAGLAIRKKLFDLMVCLEQRMSRDPPGKEPGELWSEPLQGAANAIDNPGIPSGYSYLLQFIAHDMVDSVRSMSLAKDQAGLAVTVPAFRNARHRALMLDTLYGDGPDQNPFAYEITNATAALPRTLFRTGQLRAGGSAPEPRIFCPYRDIARSKPPEGAGDAVTEAYVSDARNDSHALVSQLTLLFQLLHNTIMKATPAPVQASGPFDIATENAYRRFTCARFVTSMIYRNIIEHDVLRRILDRDVYAAYSTSQHLPLDDAAQVPAEFFAGAFRFGHAMVRQGYVPNRGVSAPLSFYEALRLSSRRRNAPVTSAWAVDWSLFFESPGSTGPVNFARRIGPCYAGGLMQEGSKTLGQQVEGLSFTDQGLPSRDLLTSAYSGLWSVPALFREISKCLEAKGVGNLLPPFAVWQEPLRQWLKGAGDARLSNDQIERVVADPPLPFFVLFEAAHEVEAQGTPKTVAYDQPPHQFTGQGGARLGRFGSILVADPIFNALRGRPFGIEEKGVSLKKRVTGVCQALLQDPDALNEILFGNDAEAKLDSMADLLTFLKGRDGVFS